MKSQFHKIDFVEAINGSWRIFKDNLGMAIVSCLIAQVASSALMMMIWGMGIALIFGLGAPIIAILEKGGNKGPSATTIGIIIFIFIIAFLMFMVIQIIISVVVSAGLLSYYIKFVKDEKGPELKQLIVFDNRLWHLFLFQIIFIFISCSLVFISLAPGGVFLGLAAAEKISIVPGVVLGILGMLVMIVLIAYLNLALFQGPYFIIDKRVGPLSAMTLSIESMKGNKFGLLCIQMILAVIILLLANITGGLCMIFVAPLMLLAYANVYVTIVGEGFIPEQLEIEKQSREMTGDKNFYS